MAAKPRKVDLGYVARPQFAAFHARRQRWACIVAHRRAGKSVACVMDLIDAALRCNLPDGRFSYLAPTYTQAKDVCWQYLKRFTANIPGVEQRESDLMVIVPNAYREDVTDAAGNVVTDAEGNAQRVATASSISRIRLYGAENYDRLRGTYNDGLVLDEYADISPRAWPEVLRPSLADRRGWAVFIGTPRGRNDFWRVHEFAEQHPKEWFSLVLRADQTGLLTEAELDDMRAMTTLEQFAQEFLCSFDAAILGAYFGKELAEAEAQGRITDVPYDPLLPVHTSWDLGIGDSTAVWFFQVSRKELRVIDHSEASGHGLPHYAAVLEARGYTYGTEYLPHDAQARQLGSGRTLWETLRELTGRNPRILPQQNVMDGINAARVSLASAWFDAGRCYDGLEALRAYRADYDERRKVFTDRPRHDWASHSADSFRYLAMAWREMQPEKPKPPPVDTWARAFARAGESEVADWRIV
jgi:phage terminase large subunit